MIYYVIIAIFLNRHNEMCSHLSEKRQKAVFWGPDKFQNHANEGKGNAGRKERGGRKEEKRKKQWLQS